MPDWNVVFLQRSDHVFGLVRRDDAILRSLEEDYGRPKGDRHG
jgi:hypothetical protein